MKISSLSALSLLLFVGGIYWISTPQSTNPKLPLPSDGTIVKENAEEEGNQDRRAAWFELMHQSAPEDSWRKMEYQNQMDRHLARRASAGKRAGIEILADGNLTGEWKERGSTNQAGSVFETLYDEINDQIFVISAGGTLWKSPRDGSNWEVVNQDLQFNNGLLKFVNIGTDRRMIALIGQFPHYSDDYGLTWNPSTGITADDNWARSKWVQQMEDDDQTIFLLSRSNSSGSFRIYKSTDQGASFASIVGLAGSSENRYALCKPYQANELYLIEKINGNFTGLYRINIETSEIDTLAVDSQMAFNNAPANLYATRLDNDITRFYSYNGNGEILRTEDFGTTWNVQGTIPESPWAVGVYLSPTDPNFLIAGGLECHKSYDGGVTWATMNGWGEYYDDVLNKLHADMMHFQEFKTPTGENFTLISNHGGLSVSYDKMATAKNIGLLGLNVSQYYDVQTDPTWPYLFYAGTQDQGFQRGYSQDLDEAIEMEQVISGDYGHIVFTGNGTHLWTVYPGGWITFYANPIEGGYNADWEVDSNNESVWIPPLMESPNPAEDIVYLAGGAVDGGSGSYMIKLEYTINGNMITPTQMPFNFLANAGGELSAMKTSPLNDQNWYAATTNGRFFYSSDAGANWEQSINFVPSGHYLYGQAILASRVEENTVYYGGSGYSNPGVYKSTDNGQNFSPMNEGLPPTLVFELVANPDESLLFAATEAGPYVYVVAEEKWYDMSGEAAPAQTYWSAEYVDEFDLVRFGTYGRGTWDFQVINTVATTTLEQAAKSLTIFPNPSNGSITIKSTHLSPEETILKVLNINGQLLIEKNVSINGTTVEEKLDLTGLSAGTYLVQIINGQHSKIKKITVN